ncbi:hypothetical protein [Streptomyces lincolnensis]|uniref:hypothetical protein n=1 Tax=Streptomyces lincolnensis TaxID=1915 RepID=UPI0013757ECD|nr:hypothetical protein [Streptomyces lincolnensis]
MRSFADDEEVQQVEVEVEDGIEFAVQEDGCLGGGSHGGNARGDRRARARAGR